MNQMILLDTHFVLLGQVLLTLSGSCSVCLCVGVSVCPFSLFCLLALLGVQREISAATVQEMQ